MNKLKVCYRTFPLDWFEDHTEYFKLSKIHDLTIEIKTIDLCPAILKFRYEEEKGKYENKWIAHVFNHREIIRFLLENNVNFYIDGNDKTFSEFAYGFGYVKEQEVKDV